jgi:NAD(P)H-hydrate epimerase
MLNMENAITREYVRTRIPRRPPDAHKGVFGHLFVLAGSPGFTGAASLACDGALKSGVGLVTLGIPASLNPIMEVKTTEAMTYPLPETREHTLSPAAVQSALEFARRCSALALGPGMSRNRETESFVHQFLEKADVPAVVDADGLNALAAHLEALHARKAPTILTPHPGEMSRLTGKSTADIQRDRERSAVELAQRWNVFVVLKGRSTIIASPDGEAVVNTTGGSGLARGGTGDVLTGLIGGFLAQRISPWDAAVLGVYLHGLAGDLAAKKHTEWGMIASDIVQTLPEAWKYITEERDGTG